MYVQRSLASLLGTMDETFSIIFDQSSVVIFIHFAHVPEILKIVTANRLHTLKSINSIISTNQTVIHCF